MAKKDDAGTQEFDAVDAGRTAALGNTATGMAKRDRDGTLAEEDDSGRVGSETSDQIKPDYIATKATAPIGQQAEEAMFTTNGSIPVGVVASNSGWVPVSAVTRDPDEAEKRVEDGIITFQEGLTSTNSRQRLTPEKISSMGGAELRAVATDRGYVISDAAGTRAVRASFSKAQEEDDTLEG